MKKSSYHSMRYLKNDFIGGTVSTYDFHFLTGAPPQTKDYLTLFKPFQPHVWTLIVASVVAITVALIFINKMHAKWSNYELKESTYQSKYGSMN